MSFAGGLDGLPRLRDFGLHLAHQPIARFKFAQQLGALQFQVQQRSVQLPHQLRIIRLPHLRGEARGHARRLGFQRLDAAPGLRNPRLRLLPFGSEIGRLLQHHGLLLVRRYPAFGGPEADQPGFGFGQSLFVSLPLGLKKLEGAAGLVHRQVLLQVQTRKGVQNSCGQLRIFRIVFHADQVGQFDGLDHQVIL